MKERCYNSHSERFGFYGGRGVTVCDRWLHSFENFAEDMGERPPGLEIDRWPNKYGNYEPGNCRWATDVEQARNTRSNLVFTMRGVTGCVAALCEHFGLNVSRVHRRLDLGWDAELAFFAPLGYRVRRGY